MCVLRLQSCTITASKNLIIHSFTVHMSINSLSIFLSSFPVFYPYSFILKKSPEPACLLCLQRITAELDRMSRRNG